MKEREMRGIYLMVLLFVTSFCFASFGQVLRILDGVNMEFFVWIGVITFVSGVIVGFCLLLYRKTKQQSKS